MDNQNDLIDGGIFAHLPLHTLIGKELCEFSHVLHLLAIKFRFSELAITQVIKRIELGDLTVDKRTAKRIKDEKKLISLYLTLLREIEDRISVDPFFIEFLTDSEHQNV
jgi:hypothetical protein